MTLLAGRKRGQPSLLNRSSFFSEPKKRSTGALSEQLPFRLKLMPPGRVATLL